MSSTAPSQASQLTLVCVPGLSVGDVPPIADTPARAARPLEAAWPVTDASFVATLVTGLPPWRHGVGADEVYDAAADAFRPAGRGELLAEPIWEVLERDGIRTRVFGCPFSTDRSSAASSEHQSRPEVGDDAVREILGERAAAALHGPPGAERRAACDLRLWLGAVVLTHQHATAELATGGQPSVPTFDLICYHAAGRLFRSPLTDRARLSGFIAQLCARVEQLLPPGGRLLVCSTPTASTPDAVSAAAVPGRRSRGVLLVAPPGDTPPPEVVPATGIFASVLAAFALPGALDLPTPDPLRLRRGPTPDPVFTHTLGDPPLPPSAHPDADSIRAIVASSGGYQMPGSLAASHRVRANAAAVCAAAVSAGDTRAARTAAAQADGDPGFVAVDAFLAFEAASSRDAEQLESRLSRLRRALGETPLLRVGDALLHAIRGRPDAAQRVLGQLERDIDGHDAARSRDVVLPLVARGAELAGIVDEAERLWAMCTTLPAAAAQGHVGLARLAASVSDYETCTAHALAARRLDPALREASRLEAAGHVARGSLDAAIGLYQELVRTDPFDKQSREYLANLLRRAGRNDEATALVLDAPVSPLLGGAGTGLNAG